MNNKISQSIGMILILLVAVYFFHSTLLDFTKKFLPENIWLAFKKAVDSFVSFGDKILGLIKSTLKLITSIILKIWSNLIKIYRLFADSLSILSKLLDFILKLAKW